MDNDDILKKAVEKAIRNGWRSGDGVENLIIISRGFGKTSLTKHYYRSVIFSHGFAKAFFGTGKHCWEGVVDGEHTTEYCKLCRAMTGQSEETKYCWQAFLEGMVLEKEPLKYLEKFLK